MTDVDAVIPENVTISSQSESLPESRGMNSSSVNTNTNNGDVVPHIADQLNGGKDKGLPNDATEAMEVDVADTDGDDSQETSSTENGTTVDDCKSNENTGKGSLRSSPENTRESLTATNPLSIENKPGEETSTSPSNGDSSNACDGISPDITSPGHKQNSISESPHKAAEPMDVGDVITASIADKNDSYSNEVKNSEADIALAIQTVSADDKKTEEQCENGKIAAPIKAKDEISPDVPAKKCTDVTDSTKDSLPHAATNSTPENKPNGAIRETENDDTGIVDLGDDTDEDVRESLPNEQHQRSQMQNSEAGNAANAVNLSVNKAKSVCSDSDGAVVIGSDSDNEAENPKSVAPKITDMKVEAPQEIMDDDDDDCVVIEDDAPEPSSMQADVTKRKSMPGDIGMNSDDSQPPNKRQRTSMPLPPMNQITIKDARSLMPQDVPGLKDPNDPLGIYPVNIRPAGSASGPPKLVPVSNSVNLSPSTLPGMNTSNNLLPGLTDDMYVLEAPSFIVPYIYEKPPTDSLRAVVREIEVRYKLSKEDLAEADKSDEFDMMTEQNKEERDNKAAKKSKKRRGEADPDDSWSEESEEDEDEEDEEDSETGMRTKVLIKEAHNDLTALKGAIKPAAAVAGITPASSAAPAAKSGQENYFESPLGKFFMDIGVGLVQEFVQSDLIRLQKRKMRKSLGKNIMEFERAISALSGNLEASRKKNAPFKFTLKRCEFCNFKSESALSMANHYETPHMNGPIYKCNFCTYEIRNANEIVYHMEAVHNIKARLVKPLPYHQCPNCGFEDNGKAKLARHQPVCAKKFRPECNLMPPHDWEAPAKIPRIKPRHGLVGTATAYQAMAAQAAAQKAALASIQQQQQQAAQARSLQAAALAAQNAANKIRGRPPATPKQGPSPVAPMIRGPSQVRNPMATNVMVPNNYQLSGAQIIQNPTANVMAKKTLSGQPSISITPLPRQSGTATSPSSSKMPPTGIKPGQSPGGNKAQFVICEICDGYIKDLEQLRNHMQWMHKVKIHPKMIYNRPPLNCQKCQFRFFTDQGLERHLLGSHGLVTSSMQEAANKGKDAGRCPVCGRLYQWKLLNHVSRDHHMTLKPAHLSYKCTVCTATFGMYKQFETHVYTAHSTVAKKAMDGKRNASPATTTSTMTVGNQRSFGATNDSLLKPLKINDEITIIPQPASKPRIMNMESHVID